MTDNDPRERLLAERERVQGLIGGVRSDLGDESQEFGEEFQDPNRAGQDPVPDGSETNERETDLSILESLERDLVEVEAALARIDDGTYGLDEITGEPIDPERLEAIPTARTNVADA
jgi:RNA polymerase-binding transcription factor DksA